MHVQETGFGILCLRNIHSDIRCVGRDQLREKGVGEIPQCILYAVKVVTRLKSCIGDARSEDIFVGILGVECRQANTIAEQAVAIGIYANIITGGIAVDILEIATVQGHGKVVKRDLQLRILLEVVD